MLIIFLLLIILITMMTSVHGSKMIMNSSRVCPESFHPCGNLSDIHYPFSLLDNLNLNLNDDDSPFSASCGYPGLTILCLNNTPILRLNSTTIPTLSTQAYTITHINYASNSFDLTYSNFLLIDDDDDDDCPDISTTSNLTLDIHSFLRFTQADGNLFFFFDCLHGPENDYSINSCLNNDSKINSSSYVFFPPDLPIPGGYDFSTGCAHKLVVPVLRQAVLDFIENPQGEVLGGVLKKGFQIAWDPAASLEECRTCEKSSGRCGFNSTAGLSTHWEITCFCSDGSQRRDSCGHKKSIKKKIIIADVCAGIGGFLLSSALCFFWHRHQKRRERSPSSNPLITPTYIETTSRRGDPELGSPTYQTHFFSYQELQEATDSFSVSKELGDGGYGTVYKGKLRDGRTVAVKRLYNNNCKRVEQFLNEVKILSCLRHQNLVTLYGCTSSESQELLLVYEFVPNGTLADHLHGSRSQQQHLSWPVRMSIAIETADVLAYLHAVEPPIIHRDVKTNNILLDNDFHVKVADFGLSKLCPTDATHVSTAPQGTPGYLDPEYHQCYQLTNKSDVYSFGVVLVELISSKPAVDLTRKPTEINLASMAIHRIEKCELDQLIDPVLGYHSDALVKMMVNQVAELAFRCLQGEKEMRPPIKEVLEVLRDIESKMLMLQNNEALSPDSVVDKWPSRNSTPGKSTGKDNK